MLDEDESDPVRARYQSNCLICREIYVM